jgi:hypothetical protein
MTNYYFLAPSLPPLILGEKPDISFEELINRLEINLTKKDLEKAACFRRYLDISNIRALFLEESIDSRGNLSEKDLDEALLLKDGLPEYVFDFLDQYEEVSEKVRHFSGLFATFFAEEMEKAKGFLKAYFTFEREWKLVMLAIRAKDTGRDVVRELQFEDFTDSIVAQILAQKDSEGYEPPVEYAALKEIYNACGSDPWQLYRRSTEWRFHQVEELVQAPLFSMDWVLSYMARLLLVEQWNELDEIKGKMILEAFVG